MMKNKSKDRRKKIENNTDSAVKIMFTTMKQTYIYMEYKYNFSNKEKRNYKM